MNTITLPESVKVYLRRQLILAGVVAAVMITVAAEGIIVEIWRF